MTAEAAIFICSICGEPSHEICVFCTKDACANHRCERCKRCSDCCECEVPLSAEEARADLAPAPAVEEAPVELAPTAPAEAAADTATEPATEPEPAWAPPENHEINP